MEKYGFVYLWFDKKRKMYYVGCHWGFKNDGYICSSNRMRKAFKRRPKDFTRKILIENISNRDQMFEEEYKWLSFIKNEELGQKYYNLRKHKWGHWTTDINSSLSIREKISQKTKEAMYRPSVREKYLAGLATRDTRSSDIEVREKRRQSMIGKNVGKDNFKAREMAAAANRGKKLSEERKNQIRETTHFKELNNKKIKCQHCEYEGNAGTIGRYHNAKCKHKNII